MFLIGGFLVKNDLSAQLWLGDPAALEEIIDRFAPYAAKIIAAYLGYTLPPEDMDESGRCIR